MAGWGAALGGVLGFFGGNRGPDMSGINAMADSIMNLVNENMGYLRTINDEQLLRDARDIFREGSNQDAQRALTDASAGMGDNGLQSDSNKALRDAAIASGNTRAANEFYARGLTGIPDRKIARTNSVIGGARGVMNDQLNLFQMQSQRAAQQNAGLASVAGMFGDVVGNIGSRGGSRVGTGNGLDQNDIIRYGYGSEDAYPGLYF